MTRFIKVVFIGFLYLLGLQAILPAQSFNWFYSSLGPTGVDILANVPAYCDPYYINSAGILQEANSVMYLGYEDWSLCSIDGIPSHNYVGYRGLAYELAAQRNHRSLLINPIYFPDGSALNPELFTLAAEDPTGDHQFNLAQLDLVQSRAAFSQSKLHFAVKNVSGAYPVSSGLTFFSYMMAIINPDADPNSNPTVWGLMHTVNVSGVIGPGLYRITGTGLTDLTRIGNLEVEETNGYLRISCNLADLLADPDFASWYDPDYPRIATQAISSRISVVSGVQSADTTAGEELTLIPLLLNLANNQNPVVELRQMQLNEGLFSIELAYMDQENSFPRAIGFGFDGVVNQDLLPDLSEGIEGEILFRSIPVTPPQEWSLITVSYNVAGEDFELEFPRPTSNLDQLAPAACLQVYPNPTRGLVGYELSGRNNLFKNPNSLEVYNLRGQKLLRLQNPPDKGQLELNHLPSGLYVLRIGDQFKRFMLLK